MRGFLGLSGGVEAGQCSALQPSRQGLLCLPSSSSSHPTSASPFPSSLTTLVLEHTGLSLLVLSWYLALPVWPAMATPTSAGSDEGHLPHLSHRSQFPSARCLLCWAARQKHPGTGFTGFRCHCSLGRAVFSLPTPPLRSAPLWR